MLKKITKFKKILAGVAALVVVGSTGFAEASGNFNDVSDTWYTAAVNWVKAHGVMSGTTGSTFEPNRPVTRAELAQVVYNLSKQGLINGQSASPQPTTSTIPTLSGFSASVLAQGTTFDNPDDMAYLADHIFVGYQNGVGAKGEASKKGVTYSTIVEYDKSGNIISSWNIPGKCDGLAADATNHRLLATVNEDGSSSMYIIDPNAAQGLQIQNISFSPDPAASSTTGPLATGGGTDSIAIQNGNIYISASAPSADQNGNFTHAALFQATIQGKTATLKPVLMGNATATDVSTGKPATLNLSDPDSNNVVPVSSPQYAGDLVVDSQGDSQLVFVHNPGSNQQTQTRLSIGTQVDDTEWATSSKGTLYVTDTSANKVYAITGNFTPGTAFVATPGDSGVAGLIGTLDLSTGTIHPFAMGMSSPHGLLFVPGQ